MNVAAGIHQISPQEAQAASLPGGYSESFNAWLDKASKGHAFSRTCPGRACNSSAILQNSAYNKMLAQCSDGSGQSGKIPYHQMPAMTPEGKITTLDKVIMPTGADVRVPGRKMVRCVGEIRRPTRSLGPRSKRCQQRQPSSKIQVSTGARQSQLRRPLRVHPRPSRPGHKPAPGATDTDFDWANAKSPTSSAPITPSTGTAAAPPSAWDRFFCGL